MGDPHEPGRMSVTLKTDGKDGTWIVFHGSAAEIRSQIIETFALEADSLTAKAPLFDLINEATRIYKSTGNVNAVLGGRVVGPRATENVNTGSGSAWDRAGAGNGDETPKADPNVVRLEAAIESAANVAALKELYSRNQAAFDENDDLMSAYKAKGKSLS